MPDAIDRRLSRRALLALGASTAVAAACGGSSDSAPAVATSAPAATEVPPTATRVPPTATPVPQPTTLRGWADRSAFSIGTLATGYPPGRDYVETVALEQKEFNFALVGAWWQQQEPVRGQTDFTLMRNGFQEAMRGSMPVMLHPLIWTSGANSVPSWLRNGRLSRDEAIGAMRERIQGIARATSSYKIVSVVVVNEAFALGTGRDDVLRRLVGMDYIDLAFEMAREAFPTVQLVYNDAENHYGRGSQTAKTREIVARLKSKGLCDKVGLQMILSATNPPTKTDVVATMRSYELPVAVTEFAVRLTNLPGDQTSRWVKQAEVYAEMLNAAFESGVCREFIVFQPSDRHSIWQVDPRFGASPTAEPCPFDVAMNPKPAYYAMLDVLKQHATR